MNPVDMRYHVVSLVAVFMALGIGIFLGSNTNFLSVETFLKKQEALISRLETTQKDLTREKKANQKKLSGIQDEVDQLKQTSIPLLMDGRLSGASIGIVAVGDFPRNVIDENVVGDLLARADATVAFKLKLSLHDLDRIANMHEGDFAGAFAAELVSGFTDFVEGEPPLLPAGWVIEGDLGRGAQSIVFVVGDNVDPDLARQLLLPVQAAVTRRGGAVANVAFGKKTGRAKIFQDSDFSLLGGIEAIPVQVELIAHLWQSITSQNESFDVLNDMPQ